MRKNSAQISMWSESIVDSFAGGGGASTGIEMATGRPVDIAINHDPDAILMHRTNHPYTKHFQASVWEVDPVKVCAGRPVGLLWASPDCKHFSKAKGAALVDRHIRGLAWIVLRWAGTVRPRVIMLENVEEFQTWGPVRKGKPVKKLAGTTFRKFIGQLRNLGYDVEWRELVAADYGAPTIRKRFYLIARCDGRPIVWPKQTHDKEGRNNLPKWRSAAEIIDWSLPCYSIFATKSEIKENYGVNVVRPLAANTMRRVIRGVDKFVIKNKSPYIAPWTLTNTTNSVGAKVTYPVNTVTSAENQILVTPYLAECNHSGDGHIADICGPYKTITAKHTGGIVAPTLIQYHTEKSENVRASGLDVPVSTIDASNRYGLVAANLVEYYSCGRPLDVKEPMHTVTARDREALTLTHICKFKGQDIGQQAMTPLHTVTASTGEFAEIRTEIATYDSTTDLRYWPEIRKLLNQHCGYDLKDNEVLVLNLNGEPWFIVDIGLRMLSPRELYNAMGFPADYKIDRDYRGNEYGKSKQVARCGNAVCPQMATALVRANFPEWCEEGPFETMEAFNKAVAI